MIGAASLSGYRGEVDGLRAVAVLLVLFHHLGFSLFSGGYVGVDVFFVISGYLITRLITHEIREKSFSFGRFYTRRVTRLAPALLATIAGSLIAGFFVFTPQDFADLGQSAIYSIISVVNFHFWSTAGYFDTEALQKPLLHIWSLAVEEQFYFIWPIALILLLKLNRTLIISTIFIIIIASTAAAQYVLPLDPDAAYYLLPFRAAELAIGALLCFVPPIGNRIARNILPIIGMAAVVASGVLYSRETPFPGVAALLPTVGTALIIMSGGLNFTAQALRLPPVVYIGKISYSLYLVHWPLIVFFTYLNLTVTDIDRVILFFASIALAAVSYHFVEQPFRTGFARRGTPRFSQGWANMPAALAALSLIVLAAHVWALRGLPSRFDNDPEMAMILQTVTEEREDGILRTAMSNLQNPVRRVLIIGDSHANRAYAGAAELGLEHNIQVDVLRLGGGCPGLINVSVLGGPGSRSEECNRTRDQRIQQAAGRNYDDVILLSRWGLYVSRLSSLPGPHREQGLFRSLALSRDANASFDEAVDSSLEAFEASLRETAALFTAAGSRVVFVGQVPVATRERWIEPCVRRQQSRMQVQRNCFDLTTEEARNEILPSLESARAVLPDDVVIFDPWPHFCSDTTCQIVDENGMLYTDGNHLSLNGSRRLANALAIELGWITTRQRPRAARQPAAAN